MDYETFITSLFNLLKNCQNVYFVVYACLTCLLTQLCKKLFVSKVDVDVLGKFDFAVVLPFIFGVVFAVVDVIFVQTVPQFNFAVVLQTLVSSATIGALASIIFKCFSSISGKSLKNMLKDDCFNIFYNQLMFLGNVRESLVNKQLSMSDFVSQVKILALNAQKIFSKDTSSEEKFLHLCRLLQGIVDEQCIDACAKAILQAMEKLNSK